jgi:hypothetical protein
LLGVQEIEDVAGMAELFVQSPLFILNFVESGRNALSLVNTQDLARFQIVQSEETETCIWDFTLLNLQVDSRLFVALALAKIGAASSIFLAFAPFFVF